MLVDYWKPVWFGFVGKFKNIRAAWMRSSGKVPVSVEQDVDALKTDQGGPGPPLQRFIFQKILDVT